MIVPEIIEAIWYKLRFLGVPVDGTTELFCDKKSVVKNSSIPTPIKKIHGAIFYQRVRYLRL